MAKTFPQGGRHCSVFDLPSDFFDGCFLLSLSADAVEPSIHATSFSNGESAASQIGDLPNISNANSSKGASAQPTRLTCNTCRAEFESLQDQRFHFKSDIHRLNVKLTIAGKEIIKEDEFDELALDSFDVSSVSGSEDEADDAAKRDKVSTGKQKVVLKLSNGDRVSLWKCLILSEGDIEDDESRTVINRLSELSDNQNGAKLRIVLLARGGHFAGSVFDGSTVVAHKTFHRYVVRAKAGKKQSSKDASGRFAHSAGAALRRYNELGLKKDIQELLSSWKQYFERCSCVFVHAPSSNRQLLYDGDKPYFSCKAGVIRNIPITVRRPTFKESKNVYTKLTQLEYEPEEIEEKGIPQTKQSFEIEEVEKENVGKGENFETEEADNNKTSGESTLLHEAAKGGNFERITQLLESGFDPCCKDERGRTPYMLSTEKEARNAFRRFMALNPEKWDWNAAKVPSGLTREMEESQAAKQAEKEAKRKARNKELKKLRKSREKKQQADDSSSSMICSKEDEAKRKIEEEREKRAAAAERRMAASASDVACSLCGSSLIGIVPFHRYSFNYCTSSCMHLHKEILESE